MPVDEVADALMRAQPSLDAAQARDIAARVAADEGVRDVARRWMASGEWPAEPVVGGWTPAELARLHRPTFVLTALLWLARDPEEAAPALRHSTADPEVAYSPALTTDPIAAGFFKRRGRA